MKVSRRAVFFNIAIVFLSILGTYWATTYTANKNLRDDISTCLLYELLGNMEILEYATKELKGFSDLRIKIKRETLGCIIMISSFAPDVKLILGNPLNALYRAIKYENEHGFFRNIDNDNDRRIREMAVNYLHKIEPIVIERIKKRESLSKKFKEALIKELRERKE